MNEPKSGMAVAAKVYAERAACPMPAPQPSLRPDLLQALVEFALDCASPDQYGHALPAEVVKRAARLKQLAASIGYGGAPPVRCEGCDAD